jgi:demethylmenaquinone methyltransferase/2-methoxy-6-polyprenyl-1,4-benzoquinol methylase
MAESKLGRRDVPNVSLVQADALRLPFADGGFDALFLSFTLELFPLAEVPTLLKESRRMLRRGGRMGIASLLKSDQPGWMEMAYTWAHHRWPAAIDCRPIALQDLLLEAGWHISRSERLSMWGLEVGCVVATEIPESEKNP